MGLNGVHAAKATCGLDRSLGSRPQRKPRAQWLPPWQFAESTVPLRFESRDPANTEHCYPVGFEISNEAPNPPNLPTNVPTNLPMKQPRKPWKGPGLEN